MKNKNFTMNKIRSLIINANTNPFFIILKGLSALIVVIVGILSIITFVKSNSNIKIDLISSESSLSKNAEIIRFGVHNYSEDAKEITKAKICILDYRDDNTSEFFSYCKSTEEGVSINIYNSGWCDLSDVIFSISTDSEFYNNLKNKTKFNRTFTTLKHGEEYELGVLTTDDLLEKKANSPIIINCISNQEGKIYKSSCFYHYNPDLDKITIPPQGGGIEPYDIDYCIDTNLGVYSYEIPVSYTCPQNGYEEIEFSLTANRSCHIRYSIEFYAQDSMIYKTNEKGTNIKISSRFD